MHQLRFQDSPIQRPGLEPRRLLVFPRKVPKGWRRLGEEEKFYGHLLPMLLVGYGLRSVPKKMAM
jgi:hypothetical protein